MRQNPFNFKAVAAERFTGEEELADLILAEVKQILPRCKPAPVDVEEMLGLALESLDAAGVTRPLGIDLLIADEIHEFNAPFVREDFKSLFAQASFSSGKEE